jgi:hypothetical protein
MVAAARGFPGTMGLESEHRHDTLDEARPCRSWR